MERRDGCPIKDDPIGNALRAIEGKWKVPVMYVLCKKKSMRYSELRKALDITNMMLTSTLKELEADGLVSRVQYNEVPPRVEYSATKNGKRLIPALKEIRMWGESLEDATDSMRKSRRELPAEAGLRYGDHGSYDRRENRTSPLGTDSRSLVVLRGRRQPEDRADLRSGQTGLVLYGPEQWHEDRMGAGQWGMAVF